jgi:O-acetyl-ADP-ribose deacetylase (regulator of RNase III)
VLKTTLCSTNKEMICAWKNEFKDYPEVNILRDDLFSQKSDAIVSPGNSFGHMDAGLDKLIDDYFNMSIQPRLQDIIKTKYRGELPVGIAEIIKTQDDRFPYFISTPTMRVPMRLKDSVNVYLAIRAVFIAIANFNETNIYGKKIESVIIPGMGIGTGKMPYDIAAKQAKKAYESVQYDKVDFPQDWKQAIEYHRKLST